MDPQLNHLGELHESNSDNGSIVVVASVAEGEGASRGDLRVVRRARQDVIIIVVVLSDLQDRSGKD